MTDERQTVVTKQEVKASINSHFDFLMKILCFSFTVTLDQLTWGHLPVQNPPRFIPRVSSLCNNPAWLSVSFHLNLFPISEKNIVHHPCWITWNWAEWHRILLFLSLGVLDVFCLQRYLSQTHSCVNAAGPRLSACCVKATESLLLLRRGIHQNHQGIARSSSCLPVTEAKKVAGLHIICYCWAISPHFLSPLPPVPKLQLYLVIRLYRSFITMENRAFNYIPLQMAA